MSDIDPSVVVDEHDDADDADVHVPTELVELHEVLAWQTAVEQHEQTS